MAISFNKRELEKKKAQKKQEKQKRKEERKANGNTSFEDMIAYVDEYGVITSTPPNANRQETDIESISVSTPKKEDVEKTELTGRIEYFNQDKGYGFIKNTSNMEKYFFHISSAPASIKEGNNVTFELERGQKGMNAVRIQLQTKE